MAIFLSDYLPDGDNFSPIQVVIKGLSDGKNRPPFQLIGSSDIQKLFKPRKRFSHKGTYGHSLIIAGAEDTMGAALISAKACLHAGSGLTTLCMPSAGLTALNTSIPEVMYLSRKRLISDANKVLNKYNAIAIGPGLETGTDQEAILESLLSAAKPIIADADALNMLAKNPRLLYKLASDSIITPHMKEFDGLFGNHNTWWDRLQTGILKAKELNIVIILKNERTFIIDQTGTVHINSTGNPAMAQGGMGDALTGVISAFVAQGYDPKTAALLGVYFHGKSGDDLSDDNYSVTASEVIIQLSKTIKPRP